MVEVDLEKPDLDIDEEHDGFRRLVAVLVVLITLFGAVIAYVQSVESNDEDIAARNAQRDAIRGLGAQVEASAGLAADSRIGTSIDAVLQQQALAAERAVGVGHLRHRPVERDLVETVHADRVLQDRDADRLLDQRLQVVVLLLRFRRRRRDHRVKAWHHHDLVG